MDFLEKHCTLIVLSKELLDSCKVFDCGNADLNDFFNNDSLDYAKALLGKTYAFTLDEDKTRIIAAFTVSNASLRTDDFPAPKRNRINRVIPNSKRTKSYPAVLIGRLGVNIDYRNKGIGCELMKIIKDWFTLGNKTGCRFIVVDSYNEKAALAYYSKCGFNFLFEDEMLEKESHSVLPFEKLDTRAMFFDLIKVV